MVWLSASFSRTDLSRAVTARLENAEQPSILMHGVAGIGKRITEITLEPGAKTPTSSPIPVYSAFRFDGDAVSRRTHDPHLHRAAGMDDSRRDGEFDRFGTGR